MIGKMIPSLVSCVTLLVATTPSFVTAVQPTTSAAGYEVWAVDQSNSVPGQTSLGVKGGFLWIWDSNDIEAQIQGSGDATPLSCTPNAPTGPCDIYEIFPPSLLEYTSDSVPTGLMLEQMPSFGRFHGALHDPQNRYVTINLFAPGGGYVGIVDVQTKEAVALFRVTKFAFSGNAGGDRSVHMSFWNRDGSAILVANLNGKAIERINVQRDASTGKIVDVALDTDATLGLGSSMTVAIPATFFGGTNAFGRPLLGRIGGMYQLADLGDLTPNQVCKENGCTSGPAAAKGGRANNLPICPVPATDNDVMYITLAGGGLLVANTATTPMTIVGEYGNQAVYGAGCGGIQVGSTMFINSGVSASGAGATQSMFSVWAFDNNAYSTIMQENSPLPRILFEDDFNTATGGNLVGPPSILDGQFPGVTIRRDSHGVAATVDGKYIHVVDRIQNVVETFNSGSFQRWNYDLTTIGNGSKPGACLAYSVMDDVALPLNDPAPDLMEMTPDGQYLMIALRGPAPVSVPHSSQGSCPGVGVVRLGRSGKYGELITVLRASNIVPDAVPITSSTFPGGVAYTGSERSDVHGTVVVDKSFW